jgi:hypothetical protein
MKEKYIYERFRSYFIFGESADKKTVDLSNGEYDVVTHISLEEAKNLIRERNEVQDFLMLINNRFPKEFAACFYDEELEKHPIAAKDVFSAITSWILGR